MNNWQEIIYWNNNTYGKAIKVNKGLIVSILTFICIVTPFTNWLIPIVIKKSKTFWMRY